MLDAQHKTPAIRLEILQQQVREAGEWDARPAALRRFRWLREAAAIMAEATEQAEACLADASVFTAVASEFSGTSDAPGLCEDAEAWLGMADEYWEVQASAADLIVVLTSGEEATAELDLVETILIGEA